MPPAGFLLLGSLRALGLQGWRLEQLEATTPTPSGPQRPETGQDRPGLHAAERHRRRGRLSDFAGRKVLLVFTQSGCGPCHRIMPELNRLQTGGEVQVLVVNNGELEPTRTWAVKARARFPVAVQEHYSLSRRYEVFATPFAFLIDERGVIAVEGNHQQPAAHRLHPGRRPVERDGHADREPSGSAKEASEEVLSSPVLT